MHKNNSNCKVTSFSQIGEPAIEMDGTTPDIQKYYVDELKKRGYCDDCVQRTINCDKKGE